MIDIIITEPPHTCVYDSSNVVAPTCSSKSYTKYTCDCGYQYTIVIPVSVCEHIDEDMNDLCDLCNENTGYEVFIKNVRHIYLVRKSIIYNFTYIFQKAKLIFLNAHAKTVINNFKKSVDKFILVRYYNISNDYYYYFTKFDYYLEEI